MRRSAALAPLSRDHHHALVVAMALAWASEATAASAAMLFADFILGHEVRVLSRLASATLTGPVRSMRRSAGSALIGPMMRSAFSRPEVWFFGLWTALGGHGAPGIELAHNVRSAEDVDAVLCEAERAGGTIKRPTGRAEWGGTTGAFADLDGYVWEVAHNPGWTLGENGAVVIS